MTRKDLGVIAKSAAMTMLLTLPVLLPAAVSAGPDPVVELGLAEQAPELEVNGATVTVALAKDHYEAGEPLKLLATVTNPTAAPVHVAATVQLLRIPYSSPMARMRAMPTATFEHPVVLDLKPGETRVVTLLTKVKMSNGDAARLVASAGESQIIFATIGIGRRPRNKFDGPPPNVALVAPPRNEPEPLALPDEGDTLPTPDEGEALPTPATAPAAPTDAPNGLGLLAPTQPATPAVATATVEE